MPAHEKTGCTLCGLPTPEPPVSEPAVSGEFCCRGCLTVHRALGAGEIDAADLGPPDEAGTEEAEGTVTFLAIDGMHCTTCEAFLAARGNRTDGITAVEASYATDTARVRYDPDRTDPDAIAASLSGYGYDARTRTETHRSDPRGGPWARFLVGGGLFGMMVMVWYVLFLYPTYFGFDPIVEPGGLDALYIYANIWLFTSFVLFYTGWPILRGAYVSLRAGAPNMDLLVSIAAVSAYAYSTLAMIAGRTDLYFDVSVAIILVVTAGTFYEGLMKRRALGDLDVEELDGTAEARRPDGTPVAIDTLAAGDDVLVRPGERIPLDGTVREGIAAVDTALLTGEPFPDTVEPGESVPGGAIVTDGPLVIRIDDAMSSTRERLLELLWSIQTDRPGVQRLADRLATIFVPLVIGLALVVGMWTIRSGGDGTTALLLSLTVLIVACPCALGLATPLAVAAGVRDGLRRGILIARASIFEDAPAVSTVVLDKTGTLTGGKMTVTDVIADDPATLLDRAAAIERFSAHPIAEAICDARAEPAVTDGGVLETGAVEHHSQGVVGTIDGEQIVVGHPDLLAEHGFGLPDSVTETVEAVRSQGDVPVVVGYDETAQGIIAVGDAPRPDWEAAIERLSTDREIVMLTGDEGASVDRFHENPAIDHVFAGVPPDGKAVTVERLRENGPVAMIGDGSNDAPALAAADVGIAVATGTALATDAADAVIDGDDLTAAADLFAVVAGTNRRIRQNLGWAFVYNGIAIPLAVTGLLNPLLAALAMATSSLLVVTNTARPIVRR